MEAGRGERLCKARSLKVGILSEVERGSGEVSFLIRDCNFRHTFLPKGEDSLAFSTQEPLFSVLRFRSHAFTP